MNNINVNLKFDFKWNFKNTVSQDNNDCKIFKLNELDIKNYNIGDDYDKKQSM